MKTLIAYGTRHGCTEKCSKLVSEKINGEVDLCDLKAVKSIDLSQYNKVIIGGSIYMEKIQKEVSEFCVKNLDALKDKKVGLFISCMRDGDFVDKELKASFPKDLLDNAIVKENFGGEFIFKKMGFMERLIVKKVAKIYEDTSNILNERIISFAKSMNDA